MRVKISLSSKTDADLLLLATHPYFNFNQAVLDSLEAYANADLAVIPVPQDTQFHNPEMLKSRIRKTVIIYIYEKKNPGAYHMLLSIASEFKSVCIKSILRNSLSMPYIDALLHTNTMNDVQTTPGPIHRPAKQAPVIHQEKKIEPVPVIEKEVIEKPKIPDQKPAQEPSPKQKQQSVPENVIVDQNQPDVFDIFAEDNSFVENY